MMTTSAVVGERRVWLKESLPSGSERYCRGSGQCPHDRPRRSRRRPRPGADRGDPLPGASGAAPASFRHNLPTRIVLPHPRRGTALKSNSELHQRRQNAIPRGVSNSLAVYADRASNAELWDVEGKRYIDFASGISVLNTGHVHPKVKAAVAAQLDKLMHTCFQVTPYESYVELAERLNALMPGPTP